MPALPVTICWVPWYSAHLQTAVHGVTTAAVYRVLPLPFILPDYVSCRWFPFLLDLGAHTATFTRLDVSCRLLHSPDVPNTHSQLPVLPVITVRDIPRCTYDILDVGLY